MFIDKILFSGHLEEGEEIVFVVHKHWTTFYIPFLKSAFFGIVAPWILYGLFPPLFWFAVIWSILGYFRFMYVALDWFSDVFIFSNESVIKVEWNGFFNRSASRISYLDIEEVAYSIKGFLGTIFNYGDLMISTSSNTITLNAVKNPKNAEAILNKIQAEKSEKKRLSDSSKLKELIADMVSANI